MNAEITRNVFIGHGCPRPVPWIRWCFDRGTDTCRITWSIEADLYKNGKSRDREIKVSDTY